jgi:RNA polymerase sigma-70 factor (ECF subfamily)
VATLVRAAKQGDRAAFGELYTLYARMVHAIALASGDIGDADDVVQEVFLRALRQLSTLRDDHAFGAWIATISRNTVTDMQRQVRERTGTAAEGARPGTQHEALEARIVLEAIRALPVAYRETLVMRLVEGMTGPEIANRTSLTPASVRVNLHRGMKLLRQRLENAALKRTA